MGTRSQSQKARKTRSGDDKHASPKPEEGRVWCLSMEPLDKNERDHQLLLSELGIPWDLDTICYRLVLRGVKDPGLRAPKNIHIRVPANLCYRDYYLAGC